MEWRAMSCWQAALLPCLFSGFLPPVLCRQMRQAPAAPETSHIDFSNRQAFPRFFAPYRSGLAEPDRRRFN